MVVHFPSWDTLIKRYCRLCILKYVISIVGLTVIIDCEQIFTLESYLLTFDTFLATGMIQYMSELLMKTTFLIV